MGKKSTASARNNSPVGPIICGFGDDPVDVARALLKQVPKEAYASVLTLHVGFEADGRFVGELFYTED